MTDPETIKNAGKRIAANASGRAFREDEAADNNEPVAPQPNPPSAPETEPANPNVPKEPERRDDGQQQA